MSSSSTSDTPEQEENRATFMEELHSETIVVKVVDENVRVKLSIANTFATSLSFNLLRSPYIFNITKWSGRGQRFFIILFHAARSRSPLVCGTLAPDDEGELCLIDATKQQKVAIIVEASRDILNCLSQLLIEWKRSILDYAVWFRETGYGRALANKDQPDYFDYITLVTCHCIVHANLLAPNVDYKLVLFSYSERSSDRLEESRKRVRSPQ